MAKNNSKNNGDYLNNSHSDGGKLSKEGKRKALEWYELDPETLALVAGGVGGYDDFDTYRYWRDQNGVIREIR